jgi:hypothetical protein
MNEQINKFNFFFGPKLSFLILTDTEKLSRIIQSSTCCLQDVLSVVEIVINHLQRI